MSKQWKIVTHEMKDSLADFIHIEDQNGGLIAELEEGNNWDKALADAHLIAYAPEMLEALKSIERLAFENEGFIPIDNLRVVSNIIKKVEGE